MPMTRAPAVSLALSLLAAPMAPAQETGAAPGDPERGKIVYRTLGNCVSCHGWAADGKAGVDLRAPTGPDLRETALDEASLTEVIRCCRPGTAMPYHDRAAYRDDRCYGLVMADFDDAGKPVRGKTFGEADLASLVAYLQARVIGQGKPTREDCAEFFDNPAAKACSNLK